MTARNRHLDKVLTGLAMFEAYTRNDTDALRAMTTSTAPEDAVEALLAMTEVIGTVCAKNLGTDLDHVIASVRRKAVREITRDQ